MANITCDVEGLYREVMASQSEALRQGFGALIAELMDVRRELLEQKGYVAALMQDKINYQKRLLEKELEDEKVKVLKVKR